MGSKLTWEQVYYEKSCLVGFKGLMSKLDADIGIEEYLKDFEPIW